MDVREYNQMIEDARQTREPYRQLRAAIGDVKLVGGLFVILGSIPMAMVVFSLGRGDSVGPRILAVVNTLVLLGPGVWYFAAGMMIKRMSRQALRQAVWVARAQLVLVPCVLLIGIFARPLGYEPQLFIVPVVLTIFFVPALIALLFTFRRIRILMDAIEPETRGFEAMPVQAIATQQIEPVHGASADR